MDEEKRQVCEDCSFVTTSYQRCKSRIPSRLLRFLQENERKHADFLQHVVIGNEGVPRFFLIFAGEPHPGRKSCFSTIMKYWMLNGDVLRKIGELKEEECPFLKPSAFSHAWKLCLLNCKITTCVSMLNTNIAAGKVEWVKLANKKH